VAKQKATIQKKIGEGKYLRNKIKIKGRTTEE
jgi:hypothetical protein